jgi:hypothetical protein
MGKCVNSTCYHPERSWENLLIRQATQCIQKTNYGKAGCELRKNSEIQLVRSHLSMMKWSRVNNEIRGRQYTIPVSDINAQLRKRERKLRKLRIIAILSNG